jgi:hypothetical protein
MDRRTFISGFAACIANPSLARSMCVEPGRLASPLKPPTAHASDAASISEWRVRMLGHGWWSGLVVDIGSVSFESDARVDANAPIAMREHLQGRATICDLSVDYGKDLPPADLTLRFVDCGTSSCLLEFDYGADTPMFVIPSNGAADREPWIGVGMSYEEWVTRALVGPWLNIFPMNMDRNDLAPRLVYREAGQCGDPLCAIAMAPIIGSNGQAAVTEAAQDVRESLAAQGCEQIDSFHGTYHGPDADALELAYRSTLNSKINACPSFLVGQDWDEQLTQPFVSLIGSGWR